ncbi:alpha/beta-hydrolase [Irpex lacteus]|nr:alpha/beta-hydrolase [Irpex lacteus]
MVPRPSSSFNCITLTLLLLPTLILTLYLLTSFPHAPETTPIHPGLASLLKPTYNPALGNGEWTEEGEGGGGYVQLPLGRTRYWLLGPEDGEKIVLIHGLSVPSIIWKDVAPALALKGYRVLLYDLYGRGYTSSPTVTHSTTLYTTQLALLLQHLGFGAVNVAGISMGGGVAAAFCVQFPWLCRGRVALLAAAGVIEASDISRTSRFLSSPLMQLVTSSYPFKVYLRHLAQTSNDSVGRGDSFSELVRIQSAHLAGYNAALASSIRDGPIRGLAPSFAQLGRLVRKARRHSRILLVWGTKDRVVPYHYAERVLTLWYETEHARLVTIEGAGHDLTSSHPEVVVRLLDGFFGGRQRT